ncbi:hypothetical protein [Streptomyces chumphonensis]|uniref:hypothetical protein n=1 Tax=Streptomyces chumphonensis TaxID=1214925 RepID=UPI003D707EA1
MAVTITGLAPDDVAELVEALLTAADACEPTAPELAAVRRELADVLGDALDTLPPALVLDDL